MLIKEVKQFVSSEEYLTIKKDSKFWNQLKELAMKEIVPNLKVGLRVIENTKPKYYIYCNNCKTFTSDNEYYFGNALYKCGNCNTYSEILNLNTNTTDNNFNIFESYMCSYPIILKTYDKNNVLIYSIARVGLKAVSSTPLEGNIQTIFSNCTFQFSDDIVVVESIVCIHNKLLYLDKYGKSISYLNKNDLLCNKVFSFESFPHTIEYANEILNLLNLKEHKNINNFINDYKLIVPNILEEFKTTKKPKEKPNLIKLYKLNIPQKILSTEHNGVVITNISMLGNIAHCLGKCTCGYSWEFDHNVNNDEDINICPKCGAKTSEKEQLYIELLKDGNLVFRLFKFDYNHTQDSVTNQKNISSYKIEKYRIYIVDSKLFLFRNYNELGNEFWSLEKSYIYLDADLININEIISVIDKSNYKYSGLKDIFQFHYDTKQSLRIGNQTLVEKSLKYSFLEKFMKIGAWKIVDNINHKSKNEISTLESSCNLNFHAKSLKEILNCSKELTTILKNNVNFFDNINTLKLLQRYMSIDSSIHYDEINAFIEICESTNDMNLFIYRFESIYKKYQIPLKQILDYLKRVNDFQCCPYFESIKIWEDYLSICHSLNFQLNNTLKYPSSLKREHDKIVYIYNSIKEEKSEELFKAQTDKNKWLEYSDERANLCIIVPTSPNQVANEGQSLSHCVKTYIDKIIDGVTNIVFLRHIDDINKSYYTIEVQDNNIYQIKGFSNCSLNKSSDIAFIKKWAKEKKLKLSRFF